MYGEKELLDDLLKGLGRMTAEADQWMASYKPKLKRDFYRKLKELKQGSMSVDFYFQEVELAMIRASVKKTPKAIRYHFIRGLNLELANFAKLWIFLDIEELVPLVAKYERKIKKERVSKERSNSKEIKTEIVAAPIKETNKEEEELNIENHEEKHIEEDLPILSIDLAVEKELNIENHDEKCIEEDLPIPSINLAVEEELIIENHDEKRIEEDLPIPSINLAVKEEFNAENTAEKCIKEENRIPSTNLVVEEELKVENHGGICIEEELLSSSTNVEVEEDLLNHENKRENMSGSEFCETIIERKVVFEEKEIESIAYSQNKERKREF